MRFPYSAVQVEDRSPGAATPPGGGGVSPPPGTEIGHTYAPRAFYLDAKSDSSEQSEA